MLFWSLSIHSRRKGLVLTVVCTCFLNLNAKTQFFLNSKVAMIFNLHLKVKLTRLDCKLLSFLLRETKEIYWS